MSNDNNKELINNMLESFCQLTNKLTSRQNDIESSVANVNTRLTSIEDKILDIYDRLDNSDNIEYADIKEMQHTFLDIRSKIANTVANNNAMIYKEIDNVKKISSSINTEINRVISANVDAKLTEYRNEQVRFMAQITKQMESKTRELKELEDRINRQNNPVGQNICVEYHDIGRRDSISKFSLTGGL